jgi:hypothetical protein
MSEPKRYHHFIKFYSKSFTDVTGARYCYPDAGMIEDKDGKYVEYEDYARLKSLCDNLGMGGKHTITAIDAENARLKAEVERLIKERDKALTDFWYIHEGYFRLQAEVNRLTAFTTRTIIPNKELQAQVERLTKAGDAMTEIFKNEMDNEPDCVGYLQEKLVNRWNDAKEGKPRA